MSFMYALILSGNPPLRESGTRKLVLLWVRSLRVIFPLCVGRGLIVHVSS